MKQTQKPVDNAEETGDQPAAKSTETEVSLL
jgi:hypothetical protein